MNWDLLQNSLLLAALVTALGTVAGCVAAVYAAGLRRRWQGLLAALAVAVFALPPFLVTNTWLQYFGLTGSLRAYLDFNIYSFEGTVLVLTLQLWPIAFVLMLARLRGLERAYLEQEPLLRGRALFQVLLWPFCRGTIAQSTVLIFVLALNNFPVPALLQTKVYPAEVWLTFNTRFDYLEALRLSWPLVLAPLLLLAFFRSHPVRFSQRATESQPELFGQRLGRAAKTAGGSIMTGLLLLALIVPLVRLLSSPRMWTEFFPAFAAARHGFANSVLFASGAAAIVLGAGILLRKSRWPAAAWVLLLAPGLLLGMALIFLLNRPWLSLVYQSFAVVMIAFGLRYLVLGWFGSRMAYRQTDSQMLDAARSLGANAAQQFRLAEWPRSAPWLLATAYLVYLLCLWDVETLIFVVPPGGETISLRIFNMLHYGHATQVDALCVWLLLVALAPLVVWGIWRMARRQREVAICAIAALLLGGCGFSDGSSALGSELFSEAQIIGSRGTGPGQFNKPRSLALDERDNVYVVDLTGRVQKLSPEGEFVLAWQMPQTDKGKPKGMIQDTQGGVIVIEPHYSRVNHFTSAGQLAFQWGTHGTNGGELSFPRSAAINSAGEIYLSEYGIRERVQRFAERGSEFLGAFGKAGTGLGEFNRPEGVGVDAEDRVYVADSCNHRVQVFTREGEFVRAFGKAGSGVGEMSYPYDVRVDAEGNIFVCEFGNSRIQVFNANFEPAGFLGGSGIEAGQLNNPWSMALDSMGNLYVADSGNHRVQKYIRKEPLKSEKVLRVSLAP